MSPQITFDPFEQRLIDRVIKPKAIKKESVESKPESISKNESTLDDAQGSAVEKIKDSQIHIPSREVEYEIEQGSNELVIKIRDKETGEVIRRIPEEELLRLTNKISDLNNGILDKTV